MRKMMRGVLLFSLIAVGACTPSDDGQNENPPSAAPDVSGSTTPAPLPPVVGGDSTAAASDTAGNAGMPLPSPGTADSMSAATPE